jgi:hypothetical protein
MSDQAKSDAKVQKPSTYFNEPHEVVVDSSLSQAQKIEALNTLEQDARQLAEASSEGMGGGERTNLHDVLIAEDALAPDEQRPLVVTATAARSAVKLGRMRYVLGISLVMVIVLFIVAYLIA